MYIFLGTRILFLLPSLREVVDRVMGPWNVDRLRIVQYILSLTN